MNLAERFVARILGYGKVKSLFNTCAGLGSDIVGVRSTGVVQEPRIRLRDSQWEARP